MDKLDKIKTVIKQWKNDCGDKCGDEWFVRSVIKIVEGKDKKKKEKKRKKLFLIDIEDMPDEIEARDLQEAIREAQMYLGVMEAEEDED